MSSRRDNGAGGEAKWYAGRWQAKYTDSTGKVRLVSSSIPGRAGKKECEAKRDAKLLEVKQGLLPIDENMTVDAWLDVWLSKYVSKQALGTQRQYGMHVRKYIRPALGRMKMAKVHPAHITAFFDGLPADLSGTYRNAIAGTVRVIFAKALMEGVTRVNYASHEHTDRPERDTEEVTVWTLEEAGRFLDAIEDDPMAAAYLTAMFLGLRESEVLGIRPTDIEWDAEPMILHVVGQLGNRPYVWQPLKTKGKGIGHPEVPALLVPYLRRQRLRLLEQRMAAGASWIDSGFLFTEPDGKVIYQHALYARFKRATDRAGLRRIKFHDLRHTAAALQIEGGGDLFAVRDLLRHARGSTATDLYAHLLPGARARAAARVDTLFRKEGAGD